MVGRCELYSIMVYLGVAFIYRLQFHVYTSVVTAVAGESLIFICPRVCVCEVCACERCVWMCVHIYRHIAHITYI